MQTKLCTGSFVAFKLVQTCITLNVGFKNSYPNCKNMFFSIGNDIMMIKKYPAISIQNSKVYICNYICNLTQASNLEKCVARQEIPLLHAIVALSIYANVNVMIKF